MQSGTFVLGGQRTDHDLVLLGAKVVQRMRGNSAAHEDRMKRFIDRKSESSHARECVFDDNNDCVSGLWCAVFSARSL